LNTKNTSYTKPLILLAVTIVYSLLATFVDRSAIGPGGTSVGFSTINGAFAGRFGYNPAMDLVSDLMMYLSFIVVMSFAAMGILRLIREKSIPKVGKVLIGLGVLYVLVAVIYVAFGKIPINYRPIIMPDETELETSFPSTHTLVIGTVMGSAMVAWERLLSNVKLVKILKILAIVVMVVGIGARMLAGVHWLSDIAAGILFSLTLIAFYTACIKE
jgi:undecaprenyl-diphosphatase